MYPQSSSVLLLQKKTHKAIWLQKSRSTYPRHKRADVSLPFSATRISGCPSGASRSQFEAPRTKKCEERPRIWDPAFQASRRVLRPPAAQGPHMSAVATNPEMLVAPNVFNNAQNVMFRPVSSIATFGGPPAPQSMLQSKTVKRASATGRNFSTLIGGAGGPHT